MKAQEETLRHVQLISYHEAHLSYEPLNFLSDNPKITGES